VDQGWWYWLRLNPNLFTRALWLSTGLQSCQQGHLCCSPQCCLVSCHPRHLERVGGGQRNENLLSRSVWDYKWSFTCHKILQHGTYGFTFHLKEVVLQIFIALKNPSSWLGLNPRPIGPVASTIKTTPPEWQWIYLTLYWHMFNWFILFRLLLYFYYILHLLLLFWRTLGNCYWMGVSYTFHFCCLLLLCEILWWHVWTWLSSRMMGHVISLVIRVSKHLWNMGQFVPD
jgi:hypothetical protein